MSSFLGLIKNRKEASLLIAYFVNIFLQKMTFSAQNAIFLYSVRSLSKIERKQEMIKKYREEKRQEVIEARKDGATIAQIAVMTGVGQTTIKAWLKNAGWQD